MIVLQRFQEEQMLHLGQLISRSCQHANVWNCLIVFHLGAALFGANIQDGPCLKWDVF